mmetsp:Transcript_34666/g.48390  ORF Transcript_34666/g.48390 Transcript_34666/m.48390 type:complete len:83 (+) Transcript_34666:74-322(+)
MYSFTVISAFPLASTYYPLRFPFLAYDNPYEWFDVLTSSKKFNFGNFGTSSSPFRNFIKSTSLLCNNANRGTDLGFFDAMIR